MRLLSLSDFVIFRGRDWKQFLVDIKGLLHFLNPHSLSILVRFFIFVYMCIFNALGDTSLVICKM